MTLGPFSCYPDTMSRTSSGTLLSLSVLLSFSLVACSSSSSGGTTTDSGTDDTGVVADTSAPTDTRKDDAAADAPPKQLAGCTLDPGGVTLDPTGVSGADPVSGGPTAFTLDMALAGFPAVTGAPVLTAVITTEKGKIFCQLDEKNAPISVANFIGLARGTRPAQRASTNWTKTNFYDGLIWHRVVAFFVIQGGDPSGSGSGGPGYDLPSENQIVEEKGALAMAAAAKPSGSQFYVVTGTGPAANYNVFGKCDLDTATSVAQGDHMAVQIARCPIK